jgi:urease accessory protein
MLVADEFVGTLDDPDIAARVDGEATLAVTVDDVERRRSRFRTTAEDGTDMGVVVARELSDGDVLAADGTLVVVSLAATTAMVLDFAGVTGTDAVTAALELGHVVGNRHRDLAVDGDRAYLPAQRRERLEATVRPLLPEGVTVSYEDVPPTLFDDGEGPDHSHDHDHGHGDHSHDHDGDSRGIDGGAES